jgi:two-component system, sensor histidine kinase RpfC
VQDSGIGIAPEHHERIFEPFYQTEGGTVRRYGGTGLGMTIAREIVKLMGGDLRLASELGKGTLFYFDLTLSRADPQESIVKSEATVVRATGKRIFVVDDHETNLMLIKELLEQDLHEVTVATGGMEALDILSSRDFDAVFLDFNLSDMDGLKLLQLYRFGKLNPAPTFFLTADATLITAEKLANSGASGTLIKPITLTELRRTIAQACGETSAKPLGDDATPAKSNRPMLKSVPTQAIDFTVIEHLKSISGRPAFLRELLAHAGEDIRRNCEDLDRALTTRDFASVADTAHALKGVCASIGAVRLMTVATGLMRCSREDLKRAEPRMRTDVSEASAVTLAAIEKILSEIDQTKFVDHSAALLHTN